jgi:hypothetical protein
MNQEEFAAILHNVLIVQFPKNPKFSQLHGNYLYSKESTWNADLTPNYLIKSKSKDFQQNSILSGTINKIHKGLPRLFQQTIQKLLF